MKIWWKTLRGHPLRILWTLILLGLFALVAVLRVGTIHRLPFTILIAVIVLVYLFSYGIWRAWDDMVAKQAAERAREIVEEAIPLPKPAPAPPKPAPEPIPVPLHPAIRSAASQWTSERLCAAFWARERRMIALMARESTSRA